MKNQAVEPSIIIKEFDAPRPLVFDAWTQTKHLNHWMFPMPGCRCEFISADITSGGTSLHTITMNNGHQIWLFSQYEQVTAPEKLVFLQYMSNEQGEIVANTHMPNWPKDMLATVLFDTLDNQQTKLTFLWEPRNPTPEEAAVFEASRVNHSKGWSASFAQLESYLALR